MEDNLYDEIAKEAYNLHERRGSCHGYNVADWLEAERIVLERYANRIAKEAKNTSKDKG
jgi:hypothetical protein